MEELARQVCGANRCSKYRQITRGCKHQERGTRFGNHRAVGASVFRTSTKKCFPPALIDTKAWGKPTQFLVGKYDELCEWLSKLESCIARACGDDFRKVFGVQTDELDCAEGLNRKVG
eukprot:1204446-Amphidinium_carterae.2